MAETVASTAYGPMVLTALERTLPAAQRLIDDPLAYQMLPLSMKLMVNMCKLKPIRAAFFNAMEKSTPGLASGFPCRKRYVDDTVSEMLRTGVASVVILGAGLDTLAYRLPQLAELRVYEVDLPENIAYKKRQLQAIFGAVPAHVTLVPINFESQDLGSVLVQHGYAADQKSAFIWEAVTQYLTETAVRATFQFLAQATPGSRLLFTYVLADFISGENTHGLDSLYQRFRVNNPIWHFGLNPQDVAAFIGAYGWQVMEQVGAEAYRTRYLLPHGRTEPIAELERAVYAEKRPS